MPRRKLPYTSVALALLITAAYAAGAPLPALSAQTLAAAPYSLLTYMAVHAGALHVGLNAAMLLAAGTVAERIGGSGRVALVAAVAVPAAGLAFCAVTAALHPDATLEGASSAAIALAAYAVTMLRRRIPLILLGALAVAMIFGPNAGGGVAHCAGFAVGAAIAATDLRRRDRRQREADAERDRILRKAEDSGYASLSDDERRMLEYNSTSL